MDGGIRRLWKTTLYGTNSDPRNCNGSGFLHCPSCEKRFLDNCFLDSLGQKLSSLEVNFVLINLLFDIAWNNFAVCVLLFLADSWFSYTSFRNQYTQLFVSHLLLFCKCWQVIWVLDSLVFIGTALQNQFNRSCWVGSLSSFLSVF